MIIPSKLNMSATVHEETLIEEAPPTSTIPENHVTLRDVSAIEKAIEMDPDIPNPDLSVSLLPYIPTTNPEEKLNNKSVASTISDKTFVKTSLKPFSSDEESDEDDDDDEDTIIEESLIADNTENARPLLLTADRSIRRPASRVLSNQPSIEKPKIKKEKVSFREPLIVEHNHSSRTILLNNNTFDAENSDYVRPTIVDNSNTSKLPTIHSEESKEEKENVTENKPIDEDVPINEPKIVEEEVPINEPTIVEKIPIEIVEKVPINQPKIAEELSVPPPVENNPKRRTTRRTTTRLFRESQNGIKMR
jgi:hypothetical protein